MDLTTIGDTVIKPFTHSDVKNKELVIKMLNYEEQLTKSDYGQSLYRNTLNKPLISLNIEKAINRLVLAHFNFDTDDQSVAAYRTIFKNYYQGPTDYDPDVLNAVHYMRENKCVYYKERVLQVGDKLPNCGLYNLDGKIQVELHDLIDKNSKYTMIGAFSLS